MSTTYSYNALWEHICGFLSQFYTVQVIYAKISKGAIIVLVKQRTMWVEKQELGHNISMYWWVMWKERNQRVFESKSE